MSYEPDVDNDNVNYVFESMVFGEEERSYCPAWEWVKKNPQLHAWIDGKYVEINDPNQSDQGAEGYNHAEAAVSSSVLGQATWLSIHVDTRQELMFRFSGTFQSRSKFFSQLCNLNEEDFEMTIDFLNFSCDLTVDKWDPVGVILIKLSSETPPWVVAMHVTSALSAGCSVILNPVPKACFFSFALAEICHEAGLPRGLVNVVPGRARTYQEFLKTDIQKIIYNGHLRPEDFVGYKIPPHVAVLTANHTTMVLLETCDLAAALDKLFYETWRKYSKTIWAIDTLIIQESIYHEFLTALIRKIKDFPLNFSENTKLMETLIRAIRGGAKVVHSPVQPGRLIPLVLSQHHLDFGELPVVTMIRVKTVEEAIFRANTGNYSLGTSIWTENYSRALAVTPQLESSVVWVNSHGLMDATITFEPARRAGLGRFGGLEGVLENRTMRPLELGNEVESVMNPDPNLNRRDLAITVRSSVIAFFKWKKDKNRKKYLKDIVVAMKNENLTNYLSDLNVWANMGNSYELFKGSKIPEMQVIQNKKPIGIIVMALMDSEDALECFTSFVSPAIAFGNVIIVVMNSDTAGTLKPLVDCYRRNLPPGVLNVVENMGYASILATDNNIQAVCVCTDQQELGIEVQGLKKMSVLHFKRFWVQPSIERSMSEYPKRFLKEQTTFLPNFESP